MAALPPMPVAEGAIVTVVPVSGADSYGESPKVEGEGVGVAGEEKDSSTRGAEAFGDSEEDGEDVFEVEKILDMKTEGGKILYKVRWKGYTSDDDTWEPEIHLEDCKEVLLEFRKKVAENKTKTVKKDIQRLSLNNDIFEANSDSDQQSETKEDTSPRKKKKKIRHKEEKSPDDLKKKKTKTGKLKDKTRPELESSSENFVFDLRTKKRILEAKEELKDSKKPKKDEIREAKELKKVKKAEIRDLKIKMREDPKENRKTKKEKCIESQLESESSVLNDSPFQEDDSEEFLHDNREEKQKIKSIKDKTCQEALQEGSLEKELDETVSADEDADVKAKRKKKKLRKTEEPKESKRLENKNIIFSDKKTIPKKQRNQDKGRSNTELDKLSPPSSAQTQKDSRTGGGERVLRSPDSTEEEKETKKIEPKEKYQKRHDLDKEEKGRKEPKGLKTIKEIRNAFDLFKKTTEEKNDVPENNRKREEIPLDCKTTEDHKTKENKYSLKERRNTRDETDTWAYIAAEGDQEILDSMCHMDENSDGRQQILSLGMDLQLEWMKLEDFQKHLDGEDETFVTTDTIPSNLLRDAVKNGDYITVKVALNSNEEYNLDQEDSSGMTLVMLAAAGGQDDLLRLLITKGAKVNGRQKNGTTALIHAAEKNFLTTVAILLEAGAFVNVQQSNGETALMKACKRGNSDIVRLVIECGADCNILSKHQNSALHFAKQCNNVLVYDLLKSHLETPVLLLGFQEWQKRQSRITLKLVLLYWNLYSQ
ncbi:M-phase phosphoprotein 8 isoform X4 [Urocitellus parryii]